MSGVYQRNREVSEYKFFTQAIAIRVEVNKLMASSSVVPKAYRLLNARAGGGAQCRSTRGTIQAEASPRNSEEPATQSSGLSEAAAK